MAKKVKKMTAEVKAKLRAYAAAKKTRKVARNVATYNTPKPTMKQRIRRVGLGGMLASAEDLDVILAPAIHNYIDPNSLPGTFTDKPTDMTIADYSGYNVQDHTFDFDRVKPWLSGMAVRTVDRIGKKHTGHYRAISNGSVISTFTHGLNFWEEFGPAVRGETTFEAANVCYVKSLSGYDAATKTFDIGDPHLRRQIVLNYGGDGLRFVIRHVRVLRNMASRMKRHFGGVTR